MTEIIDRRQGWQTGYMDWGSPVYDKVVSTARAVLAETDLEQVHPALRRIGSSTARRLPPPLRVSLGRQLDQHEWLRSATLVELDPDDEVGRLALSRPDGWMARVEELESDARVRNTERDKERTISGLTRRIEALEAENSRLLATTQTRSSGTNANLDPDRVEALFRRLRNANQRLRDRIRDLETERTGLIAETERLGQQLRETNQDVKRLTTRLQRTASDGQVARPGASGVFGRGDPIGLARTLDQLVRSMEHHRLSEEPGPTRPRAEPGIPAGLRPDRRESLDWLASLPSGFVLVVDGWNVAFALTKRPGATTRSRVEDGVTRYRRLATGPVLPIVVWDTSIEQESRLRRPDLDRRYVEIADDTIVEIATEELRPIVVISSDRQVRERCEAVGAVVLWSTALAEWIMPR